MQFHTAKLFLYQVAFFERNLQRSPALHLNLLCEGLESAKSFLDLYLWLPPKSEMALTNSEWIQLSFGVTLAAKFAIVSKEPNVEAQTRELRHRLNVDNVFRHLALRVGSLVGRAGEGNKQKDIFFYYEQRVRKIEKWYERMIQATGADSPMTHRVVPRGTTSQQSERPSSQPGRPPINPPLATQAYIPVSVAFSHQRPQGYAPPHPNTKALVPQPPGMNGSLPTALSVTSISSLQIPYQSPMTAVGMTSISSFQQQYSPSPSIAFPNLMNAHGWDNMFTIPMEQDAMVLDVSQGYTLGIASPPSDTTSSWDSPSGQ